MGERGIHLLQLGTGDAYNGRELGMGSAQWDGR